LTHLNTRPVKQYNMSISTPVCTRECHPDSVHLATLGNEQNLSLPVMAEIAEEKYPLVIDAPQLAECPICYDLVDDEVKCNQCKNTLCRDCYKSLDPRVCPFCRVTPLVVLDESEVELMDDQIGHASKLLAILHEHKRTIDSSTTGSGKTYIGGYIARTLLEQGKVDNIHIICPPSLVKNWTDVLAKWHVPITFIHGYNKSCYPIAEKSFLILDEFHFLKNESQRYFRIRTLVHHTEYVHATSATPIDNTQQHKHLQALFGVNIELIQCRLVFVPRVSQDIHFVTEVNKVDEHIEQYCGGYRKISMSGRLRQQGRRGPPQLNGKLYTKGLHMIHLSMYDHLIETIRTELAQPNRKVIVVEHFRDIVTRIITDLSDESPPLILNGSTRVKDRQSVIEQFQENNNNRRLLITTAVTGGVGLSLDDQDGSYPRTTIIMPLGNYIDYLQVIGRTYRRKTKSNSRVIVIQPNETITNTYMTSIISNKGQALDEYLNKAL
jgi:hypothetical protein